MDNIEIKHKIREILSKLDEMPNGIETHHKTLPPNARHYEQLVIQLIETLLQIENENVIEIIEKISSIRDNQLRELILKRDDSFERLGVSKNMVNINRLLHLHIDWFLEGELSCS